MGNRMSNRNSRKLENINSIYRVNPKDIEILKKVWQVVESDLEYYGSRFGNIFFHNHPEYIKYFEFDLIPQFSQDAKIKKKFVSVCCTMSSLILDYFNKPHQRDYILGFLAMIHKDMQLTLTDLENFLSDFMEMLLEELPNLLTAKHTVTQINYFQGLICRMNFLMKIHRENDLESNYEYDYVFRTPCGWYKNQQSMIYGRPLDYWKAKQIYWHKRIVLWSTVDTNSPNSTTEFLVQRKFQEIKSGNRRKSTERRLSSQISRASTDPQPSSSATINSLSPQPQAMIKYKRRRSSCKFDRKNSKTSEPVSQMETISEGADYESDKGFNINQNLRRGSIKKTEAFIHALKALQSARKSSDSDHFSNTTEKKPDKTARERRRVKILQRITGSGNLENTKNVHFSVNNDVGTSIRK